MDEQWRAVVGYENLYEVSSFGRVRSLDRLVPHGRSHQRQLIGRERCLFPSHNGYMCVPLSRDGVRRNWRVSRLVCTAFLGPPPTPRHEVRHLNGIHTDNRAENLAWGTSSENSYDTVKHGQHSNAKKTHCPRGHPYDEVNTWVAKDGGRECRACKKEQARTRTRPPRPPRQKADAARRTP